MTPKELAKHLAGRAHMCSISTSETHTLAAEAYMSAAKLIRQHLCAPNPLHDAAPDMLAAEYQRGRADEKQEWVADAKGQAEILDQERRDDAAWNRSAFNV